MDHVGSVPRSNIGDLHHPSFAHHPLSALEASPDRSAAIVSFSPRTHRYLTTATPSLSHGHGRSALHRRRVDGLTRAFESPEPPIMPFPMNALDSPAPASRTVTPLVPSTARRLPVARHEEPNDSPELSGRQSESPETERPPPSNLVNDSYNLRSPEASTPAPSGVKYVPPHLRNKTASRKYVPPHLRNSAQSSPLNPRPEPYSGVSATIEADLGAFGGSSRGGQRAFEGPEMVTDQKAFSRFKRGGCADPTVTVGSVRDIIYVPRKASSPVHRPSISPVCLWLE
jgi:hypothetical protein